MADCKLCDDLGFVQSNVRFSYTDSAGANRRGRLFHVCECHKHHAAAQDVRAIMRWGRPPSEAELEAHMARHGHKPQSQARVHGANDDAQAA